MTYLHVKDVHQEAVSKHEIDLVKVSGGLCLQDPVITEIFPLFGPKSGNTMLTIRGAFLDTGNKQEVTVGKAVCKIQRSVNFSVTVSFVIFITRQNDKYLTFSLFLTQNVCLNHMHPFFLYLFL